MRTAIIADIAGHLDDLLWHLEQLGCEFHEGVAPMIPDDLNLIFAGDLIHRGPRSDDLLLLVDAMKRLHPRRVHILLGNHEANYLPENPHHFHWSDHLEQRSVDLLQTWWENDTITLSVGVDSSMGPVLVSHAGITRGFWQLLEEPATVQGAHHALMEMKLSGAREIWNTGVMMGEKVKAPGPIWASSTQELYPSWLPGDEVPFAQAHGHSAVYQWGRSAFYGERSINPAIPSRTVLMPRMRISITTMGGKPFFSCDPDHGNKPVDRFAWSPLVLNHSRVLTNPRHR